MTCSTLSKILGILSKISLQQFHITFGHTLFDKVDTIEAIWTLVTTVLILFVTDLFRTI
jgi:hypothetical protein